MLKKMWLFILLALLLVGCDTAVPTGSNRGGLSRSEIENYSFVKLPAAASALESYLVAGIDKRIWVKFQLPPADLPAFLSSAEFTQPLKEQSNPFPVSEPLLPKDTQWWQPGTAKIYAGATLKTERFGKSILVDKTNPVSYVVYLSRAEY